MARNEEELSEFAKWLTRRMGMLGLKNADVARATNVTGPAVSLWRTGVNVPDNERIEDLSNILEVTPETILIKLGRMKPREGMTKEWEEVITRYQDAGSEAEHLLFAIADALLLAMNEARTHVEIALSLDPLFQPQTVGELVRTLSAVESEGTVLLYDRIRLPNNQQVRMIVRAIHEDDNRYTVIAETNDNDLSPYTARLRVGNATYETENQGATFIFEEVILEERIGEVKFTIER
jgi:transcriptional regulator with XRE-family HTH domain